MQPLARFFTNSGSIRTVDVQTWLLPGIGVIQKHARIEFWSYWDRHIMSKLRARHWLRRPENLPIVNLALQIRLMK